MGFNSGFKGLKEQCRKIAAFCDKTRRRPVDEKRHFGDLGASIL